MNARGFTLIELLVVILIISIVTSVGMLTVGRNAKREVETFAKELSEKISLASERAMLNREVIGIYFNDHSIYFAKQNSDEKESTILYTPLDSKSLSQMVIPPAVSVKIDIPNLTQADIITNMPQIIVNTNGECTPFKIFIGKFGEQPSYEILSDGPLHVEHRLLT